MKRMKKIAAVACGAVIAAASLGALAGCSSGGPNTYEIWLYNGIDTAYYSDYSENPVLNYLMKSQRGISGSPVFPTGLPSAISVL